MTNGVNLTESAVHSVAFSSHASPSGADAHPNFGISSFEATGEVYGLKSIEDFEGAYAVGRYGAVAGSTEIPGEMWLYNTKGVEVHLRTRREGLMLSVGADGVVIKFD